MAVIGRPWTRLLLCRLQIRRIGDGPRVKEGRRANSGHPNTQKGEAPVVPLSCLGRDAFSSVLLGRGLVPVCCFPRPCSPLPRPDRPLPQGLSSSRKTVPSLLHLPRLASHASERGASCIRLPSHGDALPSSWLLLLPRWLRRRAVSCCCLFLPMRSLTPVDYPNGDVSTSDFACSTAQGSACCPSEWICMDNGLCALPSQNLTGRYTCTDQSWDSPGCPSNLCTYSMYSWSCFAQATC